ncbi:hypothetical protein GTW25_11845 [Aliihoeflea aestuarii]|nr:hypothetical protein [Aliihoeflea aestuarii]
MGSRRSSSRSKPPICSPTHPAFPSSTISGSAPCTGSLPFWAGSGRSGASAAISIRNRHHPHLAEQRQGELLLFEALLSEIRYVGEIGLDAGPRHFRSMPTQEAVFRKILTMCAASGGKILSVHR